MSRLTITLPDERHMALKQAAIHRGKTIGALIDDSLEFYGIKSPADARSLVARARSRAALGAELSDAQAIDIALAQVQAARRSA